MLDTDSVGQREMHALACRLQVSAETLQDEPPSVYAVSNRGGVHRHRQLDLPRSEGQPPGSLLEQPADQMGIISVILERREHNVERDN
jgi:hypothetical protein